MNPFENNFTFGDRVYIRPETRYYGEDYDRNPADEVGVVVASRDASHTDDHCIAVIWEHSNYENTYAVGDLIFEEDFLYTNKPNSILDCPWL